MSDLTVWKYKVPIVDYFTLDMPMHAKPLCVMTQAGEPHMWALVAAGKPSEQRRFCMVGTGHPVDDCIISHVGSFQLYEGTLVFHVFELP